MFFLFSNFVKRNRIIIFIILIALIIRITFVYVSPIKLWDETIYINLGYDLSKNPLDYSFNNGWTDYIPFGPTDKAGFRAPLLPYLISIFFILKLPFFIDFIIPIIGTASVFFTYKLGKMLTTKSIGLVSSLFLALMPIHVLNSARVLTGVLATFFCYFNVY